MRCQNIFVIFSNVDVKCENFAVNEQREEKS